MASNRKKQDEKHLKILRNLAALPANKQCFDCSQRGPTYVNMTIGSFVCTSCSGLLRGLTPPHRVKSISMASFTSDEIELLKTKGNEHCKKVWLSLYDSSHAQDTKDEQHVRDFMIAKYEKKRYCVDPAQTVRNGNALAASEHWSQARAGASSPPAPLPLPVKPPQSQSPNMNVAAKTNVFTPDRPATFVFPPPTDPFAAFGSTTSTQQPSFANFENNPIFSSPPAPTLPASASFPVASRSARPPAEDKYAALKDLDSLMKMQNEPPSSASGAGAWPPSNVEPIKSANPFAQNTTTTPNGFSEASSNPFRSGFDVGTTSAPWGNIPSSHSMPFLVSWNSPSDLTVGPSQSRNPFL